MSQSISLSGKHALVCGASSGIGEACAMALAGQRASVTVLARREDKLQSLVSQLQVAGSVRAEYVVCDMDDLGAFEATLRRVLEEHGPVHVAVHNTGGPKAGPLLERSPEDFLAVFRRHQLTAQILVQTLLPKMKDAGYGRFIQILSTAAREPILGLGLSSTIRAGMIGWAKALADELPPGITINNVLPGYVDTERLKVLEQSLSKARDVTPESVRQGWIDGIPEGRLGRPDELGAAVLFLASPLASYVRGISLPVEGGRMRSH
ncbi:MAG TPA: SDR family oxidoreductase [Candidatus Krumholzibacteria bacterium]|jgi:3-oxoacyl-[acyl-carrier protein] reductase